MTIGSSSVSQSGSCLDHIDSKSLSSQMRTHHINFTAAVSHSNKFLSKANILLPTAVVTVTSSDGRSFALRALIDQGSTGALISERAVQSLNLQRSSRISLITFPDGKQSSAKFVSRFTIQSRIDDKCIFTVSASIVRNVTERLPSKTIKFFDCPHLTGLLLADPDFHRSAPVDLLLSADIVAKIIMVGLRKGQSHEPIAQQTSFGWIISGTVLDFATATAQPVTCAHVSMEHLESMVKRFYELDTIPDDHQYSSEEKWCDDFFKHTHQRQPNGKYKVRLPIKSLFDSTCVLGKSKHMAVNQFHNLERKLQRNPNLRDQYAQVINEYFDLNQIAPVITTEAQHLQFTVSKHPTYTCCVLPHHAVIRENHSTTKCRIVFDASAKTSSGKLLNDLLYIKPRLQTDLSALLLNWRLHKYVLTVDIEKMYRCIDMDETDSNYQRILWRDAVNNIKEFRLTTVTFGTASAIQDLVEMRDQTRNALQSAGFKLHKWASNTPELLTFIPQDQRSASTTFAMQTDDIIKTLGMRWQPRADQFTYAVSDDSQRALTKRTILSNIARHFDPLGLVNPVIVTAKIFLKRFWLSNLNWDDSLPKDLRDDWQRIKDDLSLINSIHIPRWLHFSSKTATKLEIHSFCDGSSQAYAATVYFRIQDATQVHTNLVITKSKITPKPPIIIPRVELCAAVLSIRLVQWVLKHLQINVYYWTDATIVLSWIRGDINRWPVFVANRVGVIHSLSHIHQWHHVSTHDNPADIASRGASVEQLKQSDIYWYGSQWLNTPHANWPQSDWTFLHSQAEELPEVHNLVIKNIATPSKIPFISRFSSLSRLTRVTAWILRYKYNSKQPAADRRRGPLTLQEVHFALLTLAKVVQRECFSGDIRALSRGGKGLSKSLVSLSPFIDENGILRVRGRLQRSKLSYDKKHPIILPKIHHFTNLIIIDAHQATLHGGITLTSALIRKKFWILSAQRVISGTSLTFEDVSTVLARIEACLNSRPLCPMTADPDDLDVLTPGYFLIGDSLLAPPEPAVMNMSPHRRYLKLQRMIQQFWSRWSSDWLSHLQSRPKWRQSQPNININDLVIKKDDRLPPNQWQLGRVIKLHPGDDQLVRVATIRTQNGEYKRSISKLCQLPLTQTVSNNTSGSSPIHPVTDSYATDVA